MKKLFALLLLCSSTAFAQAAQLTVNWTMVVGDVAKYGLTGIQVERKPALCGIGTAPFVIVGTAPATAATAMAFPDTTVVEGSSYCYRLASKGPINAANPTGLSPYSAVAEATVPIVLGPYPTPVNIIITIQPVP